jgi:hypothetical protein
VDRKLQKEKPEYEGLLLNQNFFVNFKLYYIAAISWLTVDAIFV